MGLLILLFGVVPVQAQEVRVGIGFAIPPYVIEKSNSGVEVDVIREAFKSQGHSAVFVYLPNLRLPLAFDEGSVDCIATNAAYDVGKDAQRDAYYSDITVVFQNYAVALKEKGYDIKSIADLSDKVVLGFNNAVKYLGSEFAFMAESNPRYSELADQALQVRLLYTERVDVVVSDKRIFLYWRNQLTRSPLADSINLNQKIVFNPIFPSAPRHLAFAAPELRSDFNDGLTAIRKSGGFGSIVEKYVGIEQSD